MGQEFKQSYRVYRALSNLTLLNIDRLGDADRERVETVRNLLEKVRNRIHPDSLCYRGHTKRLCLLEAALSLAIKKLADT